MKQKQLFVSAAISVLLLLAPAAVLAKTPPPVMTTATIAGDMMEKATAPADMMASEGAKVDYEFPYPGILPDHPLYFFKQIRDSILESLIMDPVRKVQFEVLQGDKKLMMGSLLLDKGKGDLAVQYLTLAEASMQKAFDDLVALKKQGKTVPSFVMEQLMKSSSKHIEVLTELGNRVNGGQKDAVMKALGVVSKAQKGIVNGK